MFDSIAIVGATGAVGQLIRNMLEERDFPLREDHVPRLRPVGRQHDRSSRARSTRSKNSSPMRSKASTSRSAARPTPSPRISSPGPRKRGCVVVDESGYWRMDPNVPLVIPEVNPDAAFKHKGIIASPNCSTTQMVVAMKPLYDASRIRRVVVSTYQATSGAGVAGQRDLIAGTKASLEGKEHKYETFAHPIAFNLIPQIGSAKYKGYTSEEMKMVYETRKIFGDDEIQVCPTCIRVPVSNCHSESILVETERKITAEEARELFANVPRHQGRRRPRRTASTRCPSDCDGDDAVVHRPHPRRPLLRQRPRLLVRQRQPPQRRRNERRPNRGAARPHPSGRVIPIPSPRRSQRTRRKKLGCNLQDCVSSLLQFALWIVYSVSSVPSVVNLPWQLAGSS